MALTPILICSNKMPNTSLNIECTLKNNFVLKKNICISFVLTMQEKLYDIQKIVFTSVAYATQRPSLLFEWMNSTK